MSGTPIRWDPEPTAVGADPAATLAIPATAWETIGAAFDEVDDRQGETPRLATGTAHAEDWSLPFGVLDYGEENTYLLVRGDADEQRAALGRLLPALEEAGLPDVAESLVDLVRDTPVTLEERVAAVERGLAELAERVAPGSEAAQATSVASGQRWKPDGPFELIDETGGVHYGFVSGDKMYSSDMPIEDDIITELANDLEEAGQTEGSTIIERLSKDVGPNPQPRTRERRKDT